MLQIERKPLSVVQLYVFLSLLYSYFRNGEPNGSLVEKI